MMNRRLLFLAGLCLPLSLFSQWQQTGGPEGGEVYTLEKIGNSLWAGTAGGFYLSDDDGASWTLSSLIPVEHPVVSIVQNGNETLMISGHVDENLDSWEYSFHRSTDLGQSWNVSLTPGFSWSLEGAFIKRDGNAIYIGIGSSYYRSLDDGATWTDMTFPQYFSEIAFDHNRILLSTYFELFISSDQGDTWTFIDSIGTQSRMIFEDSLIILQTVLDSFYISHDLGNSWIATPSPQGLYGNFLHRGSSGKLYAFAYSRYYVSEDNALTWSLISTEPYLFESNDLVEEGNTLLFSSSKGLFKSQDGGASWLPSSNGITATTIYNLFASPMGTLYAYTTTGLFRSPNGGLTWSAFELDEPWTGIVDAAFSGDTVFLASSDNIYVSTGNDFSPLFPPNSYHNGFSLLLHEGTLYRTSYNDIKFSSDGGATWNTFGTPPGTDYAWDDIFIINGNYLIINNQGYGYISTDGGNTWTQVLEVWSPGAGNKNRFYQFGSRLFVPDNDELWISDDQGFTWTSIIPAGLPVTGFWMDPLLPTSLTGIGNLLFATIRFNGVYVSSDNGLSWTPINEGLGNLRTRNSTLAGGMLYVGTSTGGVWRRGGQFESLSGTVFEDVNNNGNRDAGEPVLSGVVVTTTPLHSYSNTLLDGTYLLFGESFSDTLRVAPPSPYSVVTPSYYLVQGASSGNDFGIHYIPGMDDLCISLTSLEPFRPGFGNALYLTAQNIGTTAQAPTVVLELPADVAFMDAAPAPTSVNGSTLTWELGLMDPFQSQNLVVDVILSASTPIGTVLTLQANISPENNDQDPQNNDYVLLEEVIGAFDPNDKKVEPNDFLTPAQLASGMPLIYTIRFQNTGNYYAETVRILDTLSANLDLATIQFLSSSHSCEWFVRNGTLLEFVFENIFLPDSISNEPGSHGFVKFSIRPRGALSLGELVENNADIYFDFNSPIRTNTVRTVIDEQTAVKDAQKETFLAVSPNPNSGIFQIALPEAVPNAGVLKIQDAGGKLVFMEVWPAGQSQKWVDLSATLPAGTYFIQVASGNRRWSSTVAVVR